MFIYFIYFCKQILVQVIQETRAAEVQLLSVPFLLHTSGFSVIFSDSHSQAGSTKYPRYRAVKRFWQKEGFPTHTTITNPAGNSTDPFPVEFPPKTWISEYKVDQSENILCCAVYMRIFFHYESNLLCYLFGDFFLWMAS